MDTKDFIQPSTTCYTIYSKSGCPNCKKVKDLLETADIDFGASDVHGQPCKTYIINNDKKDASLKQVSFQFCDTLIVFSNLESNIIKTCDCK